MNQRPQKQQVRIYLRPQALHNATIVSERTGRSLSDVVEDALLRTTPLQMEMAMRTKSNKSVKQKFLDDLKEAKQEAINDDKSK